MRSVTKLCISLMFLAMLWPQATFAHAFKEINIILSSDTQSYRLVEASMKVRLKQLEVPDALLQVYSLTQWPANIKDDDDNVLYVAVGTKATQKLFSQRPKGQVVSVMVTKEAFKLLSEKYETEYTRYSAIYINQPLHRVIQFARLLFPEPEKIHFFLGQNAYDSVKKSVQKYQVDHTILHNDEVDISGTISSMLDEPDVVVALPDPFAMKPTNAKWLLYMAYQRKVPIIGFSQAMTKAGAVASIFTTPTQIGVQAAEWIKNCLTFKIVSPIKANPAYFKVSVNEWVARSLGINIPASHLLEDQMRSGGPNL